MEISPSRFQNSPFSVRWTVLCSCAFSSKLILVSFIT
uniref:Uncharacterized protein n=1 Tax=Anguilla anguilla TaxID=7936 RepID=A0A0E9PNV2_ANGAN